MRACECAEGLKEEIRRVSSGQIMIDKINLIDKPGSLDFVLEAIESLLKPLGPSFYSTNEYTETELLE